VSEAAQLATLLDITRRLMTVTDLDALLRLIAEATTAMVDAERATIYLVDAERNEYWSTVALGVGTGDIRSPLGVGIAGTVAQTGETITIADAYADARFDPANDRRTGFRTRNLLTLPMTGHDGRIIGVFQAVEPAIRRLYRGGRRDPCVARGIGRDRDRERAAGA